MKVQTGEYYQKHPLRVCHPVLCKKPFEANIASLLEPFLGIEGQLLFTVLFTDLVKRTLNVHLLFKVRYSLFTIVETIPFANVFCV